MNAISLSGVTVDVAGTRLLSDVDLEVAAGEWVGVVGPNGAGKTTMLRAIVGTVPASGEVRIDGRPASSLSPRERARLVALVPQRPAVPPGMRVIDYALLGRTPHIGYLSSESAADVEAARAALASLDLVDLAHRRLDSLSGGEVQRAVVARAVAQSAPIMVLDEPTTSLDVGHAQQVLDLVDGIRRGRRLTVVSALHDLTVAAQFCDRLVMVAAGRKVADGPARIVLTPSAIRRHYGATVRVVDDEGGMVVIPIRDSRQSLEDGTIVTTS